MASEIASLLQHGWVNLWRNKTLWLFSSLGLIDTLVRAIVPIAQDESPPSILFFLILSIAAIYFTFMSYAGLSFVAYSIAIGKSVDFQTAFENSKNLFWRVVGLSFLLVLIVSPCICTVFIISYKEPFQIAYVAHNLIFVSIPLSIFAAMWYFPITEMVANDSKIGKSLKTAWTIFTYNFANLAIIGFLLTGIFYVINISISMAAMLVQNNFDFSALNTLDFISPHLSFAENNSYRLVAAIAQTAWHTYSTSIFTLAYLKYSGIKMLKHLLS